MEITNLQAKDGTEPQGATKNDSNDVTMISFQGNIYNLSDDFRYGNCRPLSDFENVSVIGEGSQGIVYKARDTINDEIVALKKMVVEGEEGDGISMNYIHEFQVLTVLQHVNIIKLLHVAVGRRFSSAYMVFEYCTYGLANLIDSEEANIHIKQPHIQCILAQLLTGLQYLNEKAILHRDLSCSNILFTQTGILKIMDFGFSRFKSEDRMTPDLVSRWYRAPEILFGDEHYSHPIDVWSVGCIMGELILRKPLFKADSDNDAILMIIELLGTPTEESWPGLSELPLLQMYDLYSQPNNKLAERFSDQPPQCVSLMAGLLTVTPSERITAQDAIAHPYFSNFYPVPCSLADLVGGLLKFSNEI